MDPSTCVNNYAISNLPDVKFGMSCTWDLLWVLPQKNEACRNCPRVQLLQGAKLHRGSVFIYTFSTLWPHLLASSICENLLPFKVHRQFSYKFRHGLFHIFNCRLHINQGSWIIQWHSLYTLLRSVLVAPIICLLLMAPDSNHLCTPVILTQLA